MRRVREVHNVRTVIVDGGRTELSLHVKLPADETLTEAHRIADEVEAAIRAAAPEISRVHVHLEPLAGALAAHRAAAGRARGACARGSSASPPR